MFVANRAMTITRNVCLLIVLASLVVLSGCSCKEFEEQIVLGRGRVTLDRMSGAVCVYLLMTLCWALVYSIQEARYPGSFRAPDDVLGWSEFLYFSFTTITTLGYGDITPISASARVLANFEAMVGAFYLATLVARLASLFRLRDDRRRR